MQKQREERRRKAAEAKEKRLEDAKEAEGRGGIEAVDFLHKIRAYREANGISEFPEAWDAGDMWEDSAFSQSQIRVCVRKRPMLRIEQTKHDFDVISAEVGHASLVVHEPKTKVGPRNRAAQPIAPSPPKSPGAAPCLLLRGAQPRSSPPVACVRDGAGRPDEGGRGAPLHL